MKLHWKGKIYKVNIGFAVKTSNFGGCLVECSAEMPVLKCALGFPRAALLNERKIIVFHVRHMRPPLKFLV